MKMIYVPENGEEVQYELKTDPEEAQYWTTYRLKKSDIKIKSKADRSTAARLRGEILDDITSTEKRDTKRPDKVSKKRSGTIVRNNVKKRKAK